MVEARGATQKLAIDAVAAAEESVCRSWAAVFWLLGRPEPELESVQLTCFACLESFRAAAPESTDVPFRANFISEALRLVVFRASCDYSHVVKDVVKLQTAIANSLS